MIPKWLAIEGFTSMVRESVGDTEAKFFHPGVGYRKEFTEAKDHEVESSEFWKEIERFKEIADGTGDEYGYFNIACTGLHKKLRPLATALRRIRGPQEFFEGSRILDSSYEEYRERVVGLGRDKSDAEFLYNRVRIIDNLTLAKGSGRALFSESLFQHFPAYRDLPGRLVRDLYDQLSVFLRDQRNRTITRRDLESKIREQIPHEPPPIRIHTAMKANDVEGDGTLKFQWADFFALETRAYPPAEEWDRRLVGELADAKAWIRDHRDSRRLLLAGERRLSAALAIGSVFSAVSGFAIEMRHRDAVYATDAHSTPATPGYELVTELAGALVGERLVVTVGVLRDIAGEVDGYLTEEEMLDLPRLHIKGSDPIVDAEQANLMVAKIKGLISSAVDRAGAKQIDLFVAIPSFLALFLGHRLNATATVQCYEWLGTGRYAPTCRLLT